MSNNLIPQTTTKNINNTVDKLKTEDNKVNLTILGEDASNKLISAIDAKGKFILAVIQIGRYILTQLLATVGPCIEKSKNNWIEITKDGLLLIKKIGNSIEVECIPVGVLGILTTISILPEIQKYIPNINIPFLDFNLPDIQPYISRLKHIYDSIDFSRVFKLNIQDLLIPKLLLCLKNGLTPDACLKIVTKK